MCTIKTINKKKTNKPHALSSRVWILVSITLKELLSAYLSNASISAHDCNEHHNTCIQSRSHMYVSKNLYLSLLPSMLLTKRKEKCQVSHSAIWRKQTRILRVLPKKQGLITILVFSPSFHYTKVTERQISVSRKSILYAEMAKKEKKEKEQTPTWNSMSLNGCTMWFSSILLNFGSHSYLRTFTFSSYWCEHWCCVTCTHAS